MIADWCLGIQPGDEVLIMSDTKTSPMYTNTLAGSIHPRGGGLCIITMPTIHIANQELPDMILGVIMESDFFINALNPTITQTKVYQAARKAGKRYLLASTPTEENWTPGAATDDLEIVKQIAPKYYDTFKDAKKIHITSEFGTDVTFKCDPLGIRTSNETSTRRGTRVRNRNLFSRQIRDMPYRGLSQWNRCL